MDKNNSLVELPRYFQALNEEKSSGNLTLVKTSQLITLYLVSLCCLGLGLFLLVNEFKPLKNYQLYLSISFFGLSLYLLLMAYKKYSISYSHLSIEKSGLQMNHLFFGSKLIPWGEIRAIHRNSIHTSKLKLPIQVHHQNIFYNQLRREYYSDVYRPLIKPDFVDVENLPFDENQLSQILRHLYHRGWSHPYEYVDLLENTLFYDNGQNAKCIQAAAVLHFLRQGQDSPRYLKLITDVRGALELLVLNLPPSLREDITMEFMTKTPEIYSENTFIE